MKAKKILKRIAESQYSKPEKYKKKALKKIRKHNSNFLNSLEYIGYLDSLPESNKPDVSSHVISQDDYKTFLSGIVNVMKNSGTIQDAEDLVDTNLPAKEINISVYKITLDGATDPEVFIASDDIDISKVKEMIVTGINLPVESDTNDSQ